MKALIKVGYSCNNLCTFCHTNDVRHIDDTALGVHAKIERAAELGYTMAVLSGGEPTMRPELIKWARHSHARGLKFGLVTNGRMLSYPELTDRLQSLGLEYVYMSLHGGTAKIHNSMVRAHAFDTTFGAVKTLSGRGLDLTVNCVVTARNMDHLIPLVDLLLPFDDVCLKFSMVAPKGAADTLFTAVIPKVSDVAVRVAEAIRYGQERSQGLRFAHDGIPLCLLPGLESLYDDLKTHGFASMSEVYEPDFYPVDNGDSAQTERCAGCALRGPCVGLYRKYFDAFGDDELRPVTGTRSNSFNYTWERELPWAQGDPCPISDSILPYDRGRHLFVRRGEVLHQYRTHTRDFSDPELWEIKFDRAQVYVDISDKEAPDDFAADLRKLRPHDACTGCEHFDLCARAWEIIDEDLFSRDDQKVHDLIAGLQGDVLDVGCGETRYADVLEPAARQGALRYHGIEPDSRLANAVRASRPWAHITNSPVEQVELEDQSLDHVLVLRSYNHFREPAEVLRKLARALRPGGSMVIVDNVAFGLVRSQEQTERAETGSSGFEHYNNHASVDAMTQVPDDLLSLVDHFPVTAEGSNQWLLHYTRSTAQAANDD